MAADRADAIFLLDQAERCRVEASRQPLGSGAARLRLQADHLAAAGRRMLRQLAEAEQAEAVQS